MGSLEDELPNGGSPDKHVCARVLVEVSHRNGSERKFARLDSWKSSTSGGLLTRSSRRAAVEAAAGRCPGGKSVRSDSTNFGLQELFELTHLTQKEAAIALKVSVHVFKKRCSELGIKDWRVISKSLKMFATTRNGGLKSPAPMGKNGRENRASLGPSAVDNAEHAATTSNPGVLHYTLKTAKDVSKATGVDCKQVNLRRPSVRSTPRIIENALRQSERASQKLEARQDNELFEDCMRYKELLELDMTTAFVAEGEVAKMKRTFKDALGRLQTIFGYLQAKVKSMDHKARLAGNPSAIANRLRGGGAGTSPPNWPSTSSQESDPNWGTTYQQYYDVLVKHLDGPLSTILLEQHRRGMSSLYHHVDTMATWLIGLGYGGDDWDEESFREFLRDLSSGLLDPRPILSSLLKHKNLEPPPYVVQTIWRKGLNGIGGPQFFNNEL